MLVASTSALHREDAGVLDFTLTGAGHGPAKQVAVDGDNVITTDDSSCYVASRKIEDGSLVWRRYVCSRKESGHALAVADKTMFTMDASGVARAWMKDTGALLWDTQTPGEGKAGAWSLDDDHVLVSAGGDISVLKARGGAIVDTISSVKALNQKLKSGESAQVLTFKSTDTKTIQGLVAFVSEDGTTSRMWSVSVAIGNDEFSSTKAINAKNVVASSIRTQSLDGSLYGFGVTSSGSAIVFSLDGKSSDELPASLFSETWDSITAVLPSGSGTGVSVHAVDSEGKNTMGLFEKMGNEWKPLVHGPPTGGLAYCPAAKLLISVNSESLEASIDGSTPEPIAGDNINLSEEPTENLSILECSPGLFVVLHSTPGGTTTQMSFTVSGKLVTMKLGWSAEEGLSSVSSALILDASHLGLDDLVEEQDVVSSKLSFAGRLSAQVQSIASLFSSGEGAFNKRDHVFGFVKIAVLLSKSSHRLWGVNTSGDSRGSIRWSSDLPAGSSWHTMVHGTTNSPNALHGINGGTQSREILVVSASADSIGWKCIDGTSGVIHAESSIPISSPVTQVIPVYGTSASCRQASLLLHEDWSMSVIPEDDETMANVKAHFAKTSNGMYSHVVDKASSKIESFQIAASDDSTLVPQQVGRTSFTGERIVKVAYPIRDEVIQTMSTILGDNSLLLKYINPHLAVIITVAETSTKTSIVQSLEKTTPGSAQKRKPVGVGEAASAEKADESIANLFVNLVDTVSGRVLHRMSHANADVNQDVTALITENWVVYSFVNANTRRTELGVLTLHEGMIDPKGISLFASPEQTTSFSSFDVRESKPVVLSKTYTFPKQITALGVTSTRGGISSRNILIASSDGKITLVNRVMLETRRPLGEVKDAEKKEGLFPYNELIIQVPFMVVSYNQTVESVSSVVSAPTALESQSLILAFGGPDLFFTRTSPSKGFDLLPDSFSRELVSIVSVGLVIVLFVVRRMGSQKALKNSWL